MRHKTVSPRTAPPRTAKQAPASAAINSGLSDDCRIGCGRMMAYAMGIWPAQVISRKTLRALLPEGSNRFAGNPSRQARAYLKGDGPKKVNDVSRQFQAVLKKLESKGLIERGTDFVRILDKERLLSGALQGVDDPQHRKFLQLEEAAELVAKQIAEERARQTAEKHLPQLIRIREQELRIIRDLMRPDTLGNRDSRRRDVRLESGTIAVPLGETARRWGAQ
jgi:hypothetical protein